jgi:DNA-binding response OmpR family regulator
MSESRDPTMGILLVVDLEEMRVGMERLLAGDGYAVWTARDVAAAELTARRDVPDLILVSLGGRRDDVVGAATTLRDRAHLTQDVAVIVFGADGMEEGQEVHLGGNVHVIWPDDFTELRTLIARVLAR